MKKAVIIMVLVALAVAPLAAFEVKGVGIDMSVQSAGFPLHANVTFGFSENSSVTAAVGYTVINMLSANTIAPSALLKYEYRIIDGMFDLNVGAALLADMAIYNAKSQNLMIALIPAIAVGTSYDFNIGSQSFTAWADVYWGALISIDVPEDARCSILGCPIGAIGLTYNF